MQTPQYQSIAEVVASLNRAFEDDFAEVLFQGEIAEMTRAQSGHLYFTVKDEQAQLSAVMWRGNTVSLGFRPEVGTAVLCHGRPNIYQKTGRLQIIVNRIFAAGEGALQRRFNELKAKLEGEGLFAADRKRPIPFLPRGIGVVTSQGGAVIHDIMVKISERFPAMPVYLADARVQGPGAAQELAAALYLCNRCLEIDLIIIARGGGSLEDLWAFNEEIVVRAVFGSRLPVVSGVGHEVDLTLCDLAADVRAPTPTAAAEMAVPRHSDLVRAINEFERRFWDTQRWLDIHYQRIDEVDAALQRGVEQLLARCRMTVETAHVRLSVLRPHTVLAAFSREIVRLTQRLDSAVSRTVRDVRKHFLSSSVRFKGWSPEREIRTAQEGVSACEIRLQAAALRHYEHKEGQLSHLGSRLVGSSPVQIMARGYAVVRSRGAIVRRAQELAPRDQISIEFAEGHAQAVVEEIS